MTIKYTKMNYNGVWDSVLKTDDVDASVYVSIPKNPDNADYQEYLTWVADGNTPLTGGFQTVYQLTT